MSLLTVFLNSNFLTFFRALRTGERQTAVWSLAPVILEFHLHLAHAGEFGVKTKDGTEN